MSKMTMNQMRARLGLRPKLTMDEMRSILGLPVTIVSGVTPVSQGRRRIERSILKRADFFGQRGLLGLDLFAGAGGFTMGAISAGCPVVGVEMSQRAVQTSRRTGHQVHRMDVGELGGRPEGALPIDVMIGGPPCQPFSSAGKRKGKYDPREGFKLVLDVVDVWRPRRLVMENVTDFLLPRHAAFREEILEGLRRHFSFVGMWVLNAKDFGVAQDRSRVFIWAAERHLEQPEATHGPGTGQPYVTTREALPHLLGEGLDAIHQWQSTAVSRELGRVAPTVTTSRTMYGVGRAGLTYRGAGSIRAKYRILYPNETKVLQGFPATFDFTGNLQDQQTQIGNAVPPPLAVAVVAAVSSDLQARRHTPGELLNALKGYGVAVFEPRPWTDEALIGVTNAHPGDTGSQLRAVYDARRLIEAVHENAVAIVAAQQGISERAIGQSSALMQRASETAFEYLSADRQSQYRVDAPVVVPTQSLAQVNLPLAVMLLPDEEYWETVVAALKELSPEVDTEEDAQEIWGEILADNGEVL